MYWRWRCISLFDLNLELACLDSEFLAFAIIGFIKKDCWPKFWHEWEKKASLVTFTLLNWVLDSILQESETQHERNSTGVIHRISICMKVKQHSLVLWYMVSSPSQPTTKQTKTQRAVVHFRVTWTWTPPVSSLPWWRTVDDGWMTRWCV